MIHQLLERLADVDPKHRHATALRWLERSAGVTEEGRRTEIADTVCEVLSDVRFAALFGDGSLAEAPLAATLPDGTVVAGTVDRLLVEKDRVSVIDFKTGQVPASEGEIPGPHQSQMKAYTGALRVIFPGGRFARRYFTPADRRCSNCSVETADHTPHMCVNFCHGDISKWPPSPSPTRASRMMSWVLRVPFSSIFGQSGAVRAG
ncbi:PD-(D/E)XK nuclease family protein [Sphingomonas daechungensis]|uniref:PD-(D/E)XK nuclease family protein n=1 Tax=Sphingomonas daechungensis TaxID=1176646 RepID=UPI001CB8FC7A|nr:PD-(D/E)XK nuclease family protein [Sphingomonas daechungensis]